MGRVYKVNKLVEKLRSYLLGQDIRFDMLLPASMNLACDVRKAEHLADRFLFEIARQQDYLQGDELRRMHLWLYEAVLYLLTEVTEKDHTIAGMIQLISQPPEIRDMIFNLKELEFPHLAQESGPPVSVVEIEDALTCMSSEINLQTRYVHIKSYLDASIL